MTSSAASSNSAPITRSSSMTHLPVRDNEAAFKTPSPSSYSVIRPRPTRLADDDLGHLFDNNAEWAHKVEREYPGFFQALSTQQRPKIFWIGCSDSRVPATEVTGLMPGAIFVHRNVANCVVHTDMNMLSCLQIAVDVLGVEHIIVCGHYGCAGVDYALKPVQVGLADNWIRNVKDVARLHASELATIDDAALKANKLAELNVIYQVQNVTHTSIVQNAWRRNQKLSVHGWIYGVHNGLLRNLVEPSIKGFSQVSPAFHLDPSVAIKQTNGG